MTENNSRDHIELVPLDDAPEKKSMRTRKKGGSGQRRSDYKTGDSSNARVHHRHHHKKRGWPQIVTWLLLAIILLIAGIILSRISVIPGKYRAIFTIFIAVFLGILGFFSFRSYGHIGRRAITGINIAFLTLFLLLGAVSAKAYREVIPAKTQAVQLKRDIQQISTDLKAQDTSSAMHQLDQMKADTQALKTTMSKPVWSMVSRIPFVGGQVKSANMILGALDEATTYILEPAIQELNSNPLSQLKTDQGINVNVLNSYLNLMETMQPHVESVTKTIGSADISLIDRDGKIKEVQKKMTELNQQYKSFSSYLPVLRTIVGDGSDRLYLLAAQNSAELRGNGGFPGSMGTIQVKNGIISLGKFMTCRQMLTGLTPLSVNITNVERKAFDPYFSSAFDTSINPDFGRTSETWAASYKAKWGRSLNGVVSLTPQIIQEMLGDNHSITLSDGTVLDGSNATKVLEHDLYYKYMKTNNPRMNDVVDGLFTETASKTMGIFLGEFSFSDAVQYAQIFTQGAAKRNIQVWMAEPNEEQVMVQYGCSGLLNQGKNNAVVGTFFSIVDPSKLGWFFDMKTEIGQGQKNADGTTSYAVKTTLNNAITKADLAPGYITGSNGGSIKGYINITSPVGGSISNFKMSNGNPMHIVDYLGIQMGYNRGIMLKAGEPITITYTVTTAADETESLRVDATPTLTEYRNN